MYINCCNVYIFVVDYFKIYGNYIDISFKISYDMYILVVRIKQKIFLPNGMQNKKAHQNKTDIKSVKKRLFNKLRKSPASKAGVLT